MLVASDIVISTRSLSGISVAMRVVVANSGNGFSCMIPMIRMIFYNDTVGRNYK